METQGSSRILNNEMYKRFLIYKKDVFKKVCFIRFSFQIQFKMNILLPLPLVKSPEKALKKTLIQNFGKRYHSLVFYKKCHTSPYIPHAVLTAI